MFKIEDIIIQADMCDVLDFIKSDLKKRGLDRFQIIRQNDLNIQTNCPFHKDGQERKPSFGINIENGKCHCFACGWSGDLTTLISELFGYKDYGKYGKRWLIHNFSSIDIESRPSLVVVHREVPHTLQKVIISEFELDSYRYIHPYMYRRGLTDEIIEKFDIGYDKQSKCITFPIKDLDGDVIFVAERSVTSKFFILPQGIRKPVYCANLFKTGKYKQAYICESFLNCLTLWKFGIPAMALIGTGNKEQYEILKNLPVREYVLALDPDEAGQKGTKRFRDNVKNKIIQEIKYQNNKDDINDLQEQFLHLKKVF